MQIFSVDQQILFEYQGINFILHIINAYSVDSNGEQRAAQRGQLLPDSVIYFEQSQGGGTLAIFAFNHALITDAGDVNDKVLSNMHSAQCWARICPCVYMHVQEQGHQVERRLA